MRVVFDSWELPLIGLFVILLVLTMVQLVPIN
jgi:hypothetical protein